MEGWDGWRRRGWEKLVGKRVILFILCFHHHPSGLCYFAALSPHPTQWAQAQVPPKSEPACQGVLPMTGTWHRCPRVRVFCCIIFPCRCPATLPPCFFRRMIESEHDRLMFFEKNPKSVSWKHILRLFLQVTFILNHKKIKDTFCWTQACPSRWDCLGKEVLTPSLRGVKVSRAGNWFDDNTLTCQVSWRLPLASEIGSLLDSWLFCVCRGNLRSHG